MNYEAQAAVDTRTCTCHPDDRPEPCMKRYATGDCWRAAVFAETQEAIVKLKNRDRDPVEQKLLNYLMRVRRALEQIV